MLAERRKDVSDRRARFQIDRCAGRGIGDGSSLRPHNLLPVNDNPGSPVHAQFLSARSKEGEIARRFFRQTQPDDRRDKPPPGDAEGGYVIWIVQPITGRRRADEIGLPRHR